MGSVGEFLCLASLNSHSALTRFGDAKNLYHLSSEFEFLFRSKYAKKSKDEPADLGLLGKRPLTVVCELLVMM